MKSVEQRLLEKFGIDAQVEKLKEEFRELINELGYPTERKLILYEIADLIIVLNSITLHYEISSDDLDLAIKTKLKKAETYLDE